MTSEKVIFSIPIYRDEYIHYAQALLQSIDDVYGNDARVWVYHSGISDVYLKDILRKARWVRIVPCPIDTKQDDPAQLIAAALQMWVQQLADAPDGAKIALMDADMLVLKRIDHFFDWPFDIMFTYKTNTNENPQWPVNCGVMLVRNSEQVRAFFDEWYRRQLEESAGMNAQLQSWGGKQQVAFGEMLGTRNKTAYALGLMSHGCKLVGTPCTALNDVRRFTTISDRTHILHYKGKWRDVLPNGTWTKDIPEERGREQFNRWRAAYNKWQMKS